MRDPARLLVVLSIAAALPAWAANLTRENVEKVDAVIRAAVDAHGGRERLSSLKTIRVAADNINVNSFQSRKPEPPWDRSEGRQLNAIDFDRSITVAEVVGAGGGNRFEQRTVIHGTEGFQLDLRRRTHATLGDPDFDQTSGPFIRITPLLLVKQLMERSTTATWLGEVELGGRKHEVVRLVMTTGPAISLFFDSQTHRISKSERMLPPFGLVEYFFADYEEIAGFPINRSFTLKLEGEENLISTNREIAIDEPIDPYLEIPEGFAAIEPVTPTPLALQELAEGVYFVGGEGSHMLFVEYDDHVISVEGTQDVAPKVEELRKHVGDKPIRYAVLTHHHNDHLAGAATLVDEGAILLTVRENEGVVRSSIGADRTPRLEFVEKRRTFGSGKQRLEIIDIGPTPHVDHLLVAYLPEHGVVFEADHFFAPASGPVAPASPNTRAFESALEVHGIRAHTIIGAHSPRRLSMDDLRKSLAVAD